MLEPYTRFMVEGHNGIIYATAFVEVEDSTYWRQIIAAVAEVEWRKEAEEIRSKKCTDPRNRAEFFRQINQDSEKAENNAAAWRKLGEAK